MLGGGVNSRHDELSRVSNALQTSSSLMERTAIYCEAKSLTFLATVQLQSAKEQSKPTVVLSNTRKSPCNRGTHYFADEMTI